IAVTNFEAGRRLFENGNCKAAIPRFLASLRAMPSVGARFNVATCMKQAGSLAEAWNHFKAAEQLALKLRDTERAGLARTEASALEASVCKVRVVVGASKSAVPRVTLGQVDVLTADHPVLATGYAVSPDETLRITVEAQGFEAWSRTVRTLGKGVEMEPIVVDLRPLPEPGRTLRTAGYVTLGVGAAGIVAGAVFGGVALSNKGAYDDAVADPANGCGPERSFCNATVRERRDAIDTPALVSTITFVGGGALAAAGVLMLVLAPHRAETRPSPGGDRGPSMGLNVAPGAVTLGGRF
ncbi:MAG: hypothetical protein JNM74_16685, partial [Myxococcales bacterium]|nr:hypothetical protein [Myxococcales bacterium]